MVRGELLKMGDVNEIHKQLDMIIQLQKTDIKLTKSLINYISNNATSVDKRFDIIEKGIADLRAEIKKLDRLNEAMHIYTDEEIFKLKKCLSWNALHRKTNIPLSTLQYRHRRYLKNQHNEEDTK